MSVARVVIRSVLVSAVAISVLAPSLAGALAPTADPQGTIPSNGALLGAYVKPVTWDQAGVKSAITGLESRIGRQLAIDHHFYRWDHVFPNWQETWDLANGRIPMMSWGPVSTAEINSGQWDGVIRTRANAVEALGKPVLMRWFYEMEAAEMAERAGTPAQYIAAWRRIHDIFEAEGATNVQWVWCGIASKFRHGVSQQFYPGDDYVDWIAADGYNWSPAKPTATWNSFQSIFQYFYAWAATKGKPLMIAESGVLENLAGQKGQWLLDALPTLKNTYPAIKAWVYLDALSSSFSGGSYDWRLNTSTTSMSAYRSVANDPYLAPPGAGILPIPAESSDDSGETGDAGETSDTGIETETGTGTEDTGPGDTGTDTGTEDTGTDTGPGDTGPGDTGSGDNEAGDTGTDTGTGADDTGTGAGATEGTGDTVAGDPGTDAGTKPDGWISSPGKGNKKRKRFPGSDVYNETGEGQSLMLRAAPGKSARFVVSFENESSGSGDLIIAPCATATRGVRWRLLPARPDHRALAAEVSAGEIVQHRLVARVRRGARRGLTSSCTVTGTSTTGLIDAVVGNVRVR